MTQPNLAALGRTLIIVNPAAQSGAAAAAADRLQRFLTLYCHRDAFDVAKTERPRHAIELAARAESYDTVLALGGDGVVHEVVNGLMRIRACKRPVLGVVPVGSGNDFARTLGLTEIADVRGTDFSALFSCQPAPVDVMRVDWENTSADPRPDAPALADQSSRGTTYAIETFSMGLDAAIGLGTHELRKSTGLTGAALYTASGLQTFGRNYRCFDSFASFDGERAEHLRSITFAVQNGPTYGSGFRICPDANASDGLLDICYAQGPAPRAIALPVFLSAKNGRHVGHKRIHMRQARTVALTFAEAGYPIQVDGERLCATKLAISVEHHAIRVPMPR
ncbi:MAG: diacylglycerol kinase family protein [Coriobacteriaceae bacterium]|nr:diacylglycerol kinase family protein [Coriobacteriaceae bacterium]